MRQLAVCVVLLVGCNKEAADTTAKQPSAATESAESAPAATTSPGRAAAAPMPSDPTAPCVVNVKVSPDKITLDGAITAELVRTSGTVPPLAELAKVAGRCSAQITATPDVAYQDLVTVLDNVKKQGITRVALGDGKSSPDSAETTTEDHGNGTATVHFNRSAANPDVKNAPVIILTAQDVTIGGKLVGKVGDPKLAEKIEKALPAKPPVATVIVQADASVLSTTVHAAITAAQHAGYTDVLFAAKKP